MDDLLALAKSDESAELVGATDLDLDDLVLGKRPWREHGAAR